MSAADRVVAATQERAGELVDLACELIRFDTTTRGTPDDSARDEVALQTHLAGLLEAAGAEVDLWEPEPGALDRWLRQVPAGRRLAGRPPLIARLSRAGGGPRPEFH